MENGVGETRRNRIILIQCDIIKCRNQRLLVAQNLLEPWSGYLHFTPTCCSLFTKQSFFRRDETVTETFVNHLEKRQNKQRNPMKQCYTKRLFLKNTQQNKSKKTLAALMVALFWDFFSQLCLNNLPSHQYQPPEENWPSAKLISGNAWGTENLGHK